MAKEDKLDLFKYNSIDSINNNLSLALAWTDHCIDALRERQKLDQSRDQVERQESRAEGGGVSWNRERYERLEQHKLRTFTQINTQISATYKTK